MKRPKLPSPYAEGQILTTGQIRRVVRLMRTVLGGPFVTVTSQLGWSMEDWFRMHSLSHRVCSERDRRGLTRKTVAARLKVPQYRLAPLEEGRVRDFDPELFWRYIEILDQREWVLQWVVANPTMARRLGISSPKRHRAGMDDSRTRHSNSALHPSARANRTRRSTRKSSAGRG